MEDIYITLYGERNEELSYRVVRIFNMEGTEQLYCAAVPVGSNEEDIEFFRCHLLPLNDEDTELQLEDIPNTAEYYRVATSYEKDAEQAAVEAFREEFASDDDFITLTDADGNNRDFIVHTIFEDEETHLSYIALQEVDETGKVFEEISLYRFTEDGEHAEIDMIPSDMEYAKARNLFMNFLENS